MHLAFTGLKAIEDDGRASFRLFLADRWLAAGLSPRDLMTALSSTQPDDGSQRNNPPSIEKASPDDPKHPGWPAGTAGGLGGKFRPKDGSAAVISEEDKQKIERLAARRANRQQLSSLMRLAGEAAFSTIPGIGELSEAAMLSELLNRAAQNRELEIDTKAAIDFAGSGPHTLEELQAAAAAPSEPGYDDHHIVAQGGSNAANIPQDQLQSPENIVRIPTILHEEINAVYSSSSQQAPGMTIYQWLQTQPFDVQYEEGVKIMQNVRIIK